MVYAKRKEHETTASLLRRFTRRVQQSGLLLHARKGRFYKTKPTKRQQREKALRRIELGKERERLIKLGKLKPFERRR